MSFVPSIVDYSGRQIDVELLQGVTMPVDSQRVRVGTVSAIPKAVTGIAKVVQRYASLLLSTAGEPRFAPNVGGELIRCLLQGRIADTGYLNHLFNVSSFKAIAAMREDDNDERFGPIQNDELLMSATLLDSVVDFTTGIVRLSVRLTTASGDAFVFVIPVGAAR